MSGGYWQPGVRVESGGWRVEGEKGGACEAGGGICLI